MANQNLAAYCRVNVATLGAHSFSTSSQSSTSLSSFVSRIYDLLNRLQQANYNYDFAYERDILAHVEKEREDQNSVEERRKVYEEYRKNSDTNKRGSGQGYPPGGATVVAPTGAPGPAFGYPTGAAAAPVPVPVPSTPTDLSSATAAPFVAPSGGGPYSHTPAPSKGGSDTYGRLGLSQPLVHRVHQVERRSGSMGDLHRVPGGVAVLPVSGHRKSSSAVKPPPLNPAQVRILKLLQSQKG